MLLLSAPLKTKKSRTVYFLYPVVVFVVVVVVAVVGGQFRQFVFQHTRI